MKPTGEVITTHGFRRQPRLTAWLTFAPLLIWIAMFVVVPSGIMVIYSFLTRGRYRGVVWEFTFDNYTRIFLMDSALSWYSRVVLFSLIGLIVGAGLFVVALRLAEWLVERFTHQDMAWFQNRLKPVAIFGGVIGMAVGLDALFSRYDIFYTLGWESALGQVEGNVTLRLGWRSIKYAALTTLLCLVMGYPVAYFVGRANPQWRNLLLMLIMIPFWTGFLIRTYAWFSILRDEGLLNGMLMYFQIISAPIQMTDTVGAVILGLVYSYLPFMILPIYGSVEKLDNSMVEAALDLGAGPVRAFYKVIVPLTFPGITAGILLVFIPSIGMYAINDIMGGGKVDMIGNVIQNNVIGQGRNAPFGAALGVTLMVFFMIVFWLTHRHSPTVEEQ